MSIFLLTDKYNFMIISMSYYDHINKAKECDEIIHKRNSFKFVSHGFRFTAHAHQMRHVFLFTYMLKVRSMNILICIQK